MYTLSKDDKTMPVPKLEKMAGNCVYTMSIDDKSMPMPKLEKMAGN